MKRYPIVRSELCEFMLKRTRLEAINYGGRYMNRNEIRDIFGGSLSGTVRYLNSYATVTFDARFIDGRLHIGCQSFSPPETRKIQKWARLK